MNAIKLQIKDKEVLLDRENKSILDEYHWYIGAKGYVYGYIKGLNKPEYRMHRVIMGVTDRTQIIDHINGNRLDNRKENLRITTAKVNAVNKRNTPNGKYRGVYWDKSRNAWQISVRCDGKNYGGGRFKDKDKAAKAAELLRQKVFGKDHPPMIDALCEGKSLEDYIKTL